MNEYHFLRGLFMGVGIGIAILVILSVIKTTGAI